MAQLHRQNKVIEKVGPYGDTEALQNFSVQLENRQRFSKLVVRHGYFVDAIGFAISGPSATPGITMFGGNGGNKTEIVFKEGEYITEISGQFGESYISKLKIHTNVNPRGYGPFGNNELSEGQFVSPKLTSGDRIVGFFGNAETNLVSLGLFVEKQSQTVEKLGPFGYQTGQQWSIMLEPCENFREIIIKTGAIVDSFTFVTTKNRRKFGGDGGNDEHKITLLSGEFITNVSGWIGEWHENRCLTKLKLYTNLRMDGYGPFGGGPYTNYLSEFRSQVPSGGRLVGFFGTLHKNYVESIGLYVKQ